MPRSSHLPLSRKSARPLVPAREPVMSKGEVTAERILDAAFRSIAVKGCGAVTLRGIAEEAGVALSQLSYYYGNKDSLFSAVLKRMKKGYLAALDERLQAKGSPADQIMALVDYNAYLLEESIDTYRNFLEFFNFAMGSETFRREVSAFLSEISGMIEARIAGSRQAAGGHPAAITRFILSASFGISLQHLLSPENPDVSAGFDIIKTTATRILKHMGHGKRLD